MITETQFYKNMPKLQQSLILKRANRLQVEHGLNLAKHMGLDEYKRISNPPQMYFGIVKELFENGM